METCQKNNYCYRCGKQFSKTRDFIRHQNRKTPCIIHKLEKKRYMQPE